MRMLLLLVTAIIFGCAIFAQTGRKTPVQVMQAIHLQFRNTAGDSLLQTGSIYANALGESFTVRAFKYYISDIQVQYANSKIYTTKLPPHLVAENDSTTRQLVFKAPAGIITCIHFLLGVDSIINTTGVQAGDLDPAKGMYWIWNTGYIMAKLEGTSAAAKTPGRQFSYDVGGYKKGEQAARKISLFVKPVSNKDSLITKKIIIKADVLKWFGGAHSIKIAEQPLCHEPGTLAMQLADNYETMFSIDLEK